MNTLQFNQATDYAFRFVLYLAGTAEGEIVNGQTISEKQHIPSRFLLKISRYLTKAGLLKSYRGVEGGYALARRPQNITLYDVVEAMEGPIAIHRCLGDREACNRQCTYVCPVHEALYDIQNRLVAGLKKVTFADLVRKNKTGGRKV